MAPGGAEARAEGPQAERRRPTGGAVPDKMWFRLPRLQKFRLPDITASDLRSLGPTHQCVCGCTVFSTYVQFEDYEICWWALDVQCANCGNLLKAPCPVDKPDFQA